MAPPRHWQRAPAQHVTRAASSTSFCAIWRRDVVGKRCADPKRSIKACPFTAPLIENLIRLLDEKRFEIGNNLAALMAIRRSNKPILVGKNRRGQ